ncbi:hypothetical protein ALC56_13108, partial [Trachymyrmex septentrionalis]
ANHYNLNYSLHRKNIVASKACPCGDPTQDINHIIFSCPLTSPKADNSLHILTALIHIIFPLLKNPSPKLCHLLLSFL